jgi:hypothetical protein
MLFHPLPVLAFRADQYNGQGYGDYESPNYKKYQTEHITSSFHYKCRPCARPDRSHPAPYQAEGLGDGGVSGGTLPGHGLSGGISGTVPGSFSGGAGFSG